MNWYREIKAIYTVNFFMILYIVWSVVTIPVLRNEIDYKFYIITLAAIFIKGYFASKKKIKNFSFLFSILIVAFALHFFIDDISYIIVNTIYYIFEQFLYTKLVDSLVVYGELRRYIKKSVIAMAVIIPFINKLDIHQLQSTFRFYVIFFVSSILLLREARAYSSKIGKRTSIKNNILISAAMIFFSFDFILEIIFKAIGLVYGLLGLIISPLEPVFMRAAEALDKILEPLIAFLQKRELKNINREYLNQKISKNDNGIIKSKSFTPADKFIAIVLGIVILCVILFVIYKIIHGFTNKNSKIVEENYIEERERIQSEHKNVKAFFDKLVNNFRKRDNINEEIKFLFGKFQFLASKKQIYKKYMTASQLTNVTKAYVDESDKLDKLSNIYNEAKFSNKIIEKNKLHIMSESFEKVREKLLEVKKE